MRTDVGGLWENFCIIERIKHLEYTGKNINKYFWRTYEGKKVDFVEEYGGELDAYEFKWNKHKRAKHFQKFKESYPKTWFHQISTDNFLELLR